MPRQRGRGPLSTGDPRAGALSASARHSGSSPADSGTRTPTGGAGASLTYREVLVADAAHGEAVVAGVHSPGQHLVQVHVGVSVQQRTARPAHARDQRRLPSLLPSGAAAALGRRPRQRRAPRAGAARLGPAAHPEPGGRGLEGAGRRAGGAPCRSAHLSQPAQAQVKLGGRLRGRDRG